MPSLIHKFVLSSAGLWTYVIKYHVGLRWPRNFLRHFCNTFPDELFCDLPLPTDEMDDHENVRAHNIFWNCY